VNEVAPCFDSQRMQKEAARVRVTRNHLQPHRLKILPRLLFGPGGIPWQKRLQSHGGSDRMTGDATGVALALGCEDRLHLRFEELEIER
jgi:hypothetical protein